MKRNIILFITTLITVACDPLFHDDFIIKNNCDKTIDVHIVFYSNNDTVFQVEPFSEYLFYYDEWVGGHSDIEKVNRIFKKINVTKNGVVSKINYVDYNLWLQKNVESSRHNFYYTNVKYYLTINPEDFE